MQGTLESLESKSDVILGQASSVKTRIKSDCDAEINSLRCWTITINHVYT